MNKQELLQRHGQEILAAGRKYGVKAVKLFGSVARGQETGDSDVDFLVDLEPDRSLLDLGGFQMELEDILNCRVDVVTANGLRTRLRQRVMREAIAL